MFFAYSLSTGWYKAARSTNGVVRHEIPAVDVSSFASLRGPFKFPYLDPEYMFTADDVHLASHPGLIGAARTIAVAANIGGWDKPLPSCDAGDLGFATSAEPEKKLYRLLAVSSPTFGDPAEVCSLSATLSRFAAVSYVDNMFLYSLNAGAVDYLASTRNSYKTDILDRALGATDI